MPTFNFSIDTPTGPMPFNFESGSTLLFVGANGSGKTRLAVGIEGMLGIIGHRISAHRALTLNVSVAKISQDEALNGLRTGRAKRDGNIAHREGHRWKSNAFVSLLNDFDSLIQALFAEQTNTAVQTHTNIRAGTATTAKPTNFEKLKEIWERLLPNRKLHITGDDIKVSSSSSDADKYSAEEMSDGERAIFYLIGQTLCAANESILICDEPELHIHRSIMSSLWDELESARPDCAFILISHDLDFVASRVGEKYVISSYTSDGKWTLEKVPSDTGFSEQLTTEILGSRRPILFVEGSLSSLDLAIYRNCYPKWTVIPRGSCENVIHSVVTMRSNSALTRVTCSGIVDADDYSANEIAQLNALGVKVLPVSEIENLLLLPDIAKAIGRHEGLDDAALDAKLQAMNADIIANIQHGNNLEEKIARYTRRRIDRTLKKIDLSSATTVADIATKYATETSSLNITDIANDLRTKISTCIQNQDIPSLMKLYDNKGLLTIVARHMKATRMSDFEEWLVRILGSGANASVQTISDAFKVALPQITPS